MAAMPALFISHGSPMLALEPEQPAHRFLTTAAEAWPRPRAILAVSAHWETAAPVLGATAQPDTIHDFSGFPPELYRLRYPAPGEPALAAAIRDPLAAAGIDATLDPQRGLDHGAWSPLLLVYPQADIPVLQLSVQSRRDPAHHLRLGAALRALREDGVLVFATGSLTHNLRALDWRGGGKVMPWAQDFSDWMHDRLVARDDAALADYRAQAPHAAMAHPTDEHLLPLYVALGAATPGVAAERLHASFALGSLSMESYLFN
ncbi:DODA-type extradiol aromatic ring-opening family dioxygenase [Ferrovibrio xuzhouensis]|uniref:DODA-type extradiol aromatic ring-opening family dioxygenase n=1 Tax=Ferrovibrio xuzhouensis TaxID=1576914 RepID=A0ABV7VDP0_9PROT